MKIVPTYNMCTLDSIQITPQKEYTIPLYLRMQKYDDLQNYICNL